MTREEAKEVFINRGYVNVKGGTIFDGDKWRQSVEVITEWLKEQPCNDAISRAEAIRVASGYCHWANIPDELAKLPSVNPKPCDDAISRQAVKDLFCRICMESNLCYRSKETCEDLRLFDTLPSVTPQQKVGRWIPVSERLPEDGIYLVTVERTTGVPRIETKSFAKDLNRVDDFDFPEHKCGWYDYDSEYGYWEDTNVIAWQSLPQPYKGESEVSDADSD